MIPKNWCFAFLHNVHQIRKLVFLTLFDFVIFSKFWDFGQFWPFYDWPKFFKHIFFKNRCSAKNFDTNFLNIRWKIRLQLYNKFFFILIRFVFLKMAHLHTVPPTTYFLFGLKIGTYHRSSLKYSIIILLNINCGCVD